MVKNNFLLIIFFTFWIFPLSAQNRFIYLKDKNGSAYSIDKPEEFLSAKSIKRRTKHGIAITHKDLPVSQDYIEQVLSTGAKVIHKSKWMNALLVNADDETYNKIKALDFVLTDKDISFKRKKTGFLNGKGSGTKSYGALRADYGNSLAQNQMLGIDVMHSEGYHGEGITIAVLDAGFFKANELSVFDTLFKNNQVISTYDFVSKETQVYDDNSHGMQVLSAVAGYQDGGLIGGAYKSNYVLLKTEDVSRESRIEEIYWLVGAEYADSAGTDILTSSLGYNIFDDVSENYSKDDLDGNTAIITVAADYAAYTGMLVVVSIGNEGNDDWGTITVPADGDSVLTVGAVSSTEGYVSFSSRGNTADNRIKPDVSALGLGTVVVNSFGDIASNNGTSFSAPLVAGLAAGLWQAFPELNNMELLEVIKKSGSHVYNPDSLVGYGVPNYARAKQLIINGTEDREKKETIVFPNPLNETNLVVRDTNFVNSENVKVYLYNSDNKELFNIRLKVKNSEIVIGENEMKSIPSGTYFLKIVSQKNESLKKLIKL